MSTSRYCMKLVVVVCAAAGLGASACVGVDPADTGEDADTGAAEQAFVATQCRNYQRDVAGPAADATLWASAPTYNTGAATLLSTGTSSAGFKQTLLYFDISNIPLGAHVSSATLQLYMSWKEDGSVIDIHEALAPWSEATVTWQSFAQSFDPVPSTSFLAWGGGGEPQVHLEGLVQRWVDGDSENHGFVLQDLDGRTTFHSSEHAIITNHPKLKVCYTLQP